MFGYYFAAVVMFMCFITIVYLERMDSIEKAKEFFNSNLRDIINERYDSDYYDEWFVFINDNICEVTLAKRGVLLDTFKVSFNHVLNY